MYTSNRCLSYWVDYKWNKISTNQKIFYFYYTNDKQQFRKLCKPDFFKNVFSNKFQIMLCKSVELIFLTNTVKLSYFFPIHCIKKH